MHPSQDQPHETYPDPELQPSGAAPRTRKYWVIAGLVVLVVGAVLTGWLVLRDTPSENKFSGPVVENGDAPATTEPPQLTVGIVAEDLEHVWDIAFLPSRAMVFTERKGIVSIVEGGEAQQLADISDVRAVGEGGLMGLAVDPKFSENRYLYTCFNSTKNDIRVVRWKLNDKETALVDRTDILTGMPSNTSGRHSGCRLAFGPDDYLWIGTGDTAQDRTPQPPQDPKSLGGKILRVTRDGKGVRGNLGGTFDSRIYSYGHRNTQGLAFFAQPVNGVPGISAEHGPGSDDEINPLKPGNFGWAPPDGSYDEDVPMTDKSRYPQAVGALWSSGSPTLAPSGAAILQGVQWKGWDGAVAVAMLKTQHVRILLLDDKLKVIKEEVRFEDEYGRLRAVTQGPDGALYIGTSNGTADKIIRVTASR